MRILPDVDGRRKTSKYKVLYYQGDIPDIGGPSGSLAVRTMEDTLSAIEQGRTPKGPALFYGVGMRLRTHRFDAGVERKRDAEGGPSGNAARMKTRVGAGFHNPTLSFPSFLVFDVRCVSRSRTPGVCQRESHSCQGRREALGQNTTRRFIRERGISSVYWQTARSRSRPQGPVLSAGPEPHESAHPLPWSACGF
jgi:hypothetical protein